MAKTTITASLGVAVKTSNYSADWSDGVILCNGTLTITLPSAASGVGRRLMIKNIGTGVVTLTPNAGDRIDGETSQTLTGQMLSVDLTADGGTSVYIL